MNDRRSDEAQGRGTAPLGEADAVWLDAALHEALAGESPPDLRARLAAASPAQAAAAAARVDAAGAPRSWVQAWAAAAVFLGVSVVGGVFALQRFGDGAADVPAVSAQEPARELDVADGKQLAAHLARTTTVAMTALQSPDGVRLPNEPEHGAILHDATLLPALRLVFPADVATTEPFALRDTQAELRLAGEGGFVRLRLTIHGDVVRVGAAKFACTVALPAELAGKLRAEWQVLAAQKPPARQRMQVHTTRQLLAAIGDDRTIELVGGPFVLDPEDAEGPLPVSAAVEFGERDPVPYVVVKGVRNLQLRAVGGPVRVLSRSPAEVLQLAGCRDVLLEGLVLGHTQDVQYHCVAPVVSLQQSTNIVLRDCELFGCGTEGIVAEKSEGLRMERGEIHTCRNGAVIFLGCKDLAFHGVLFRDCQVGLTAFAFDQCQGVRFHDCVIRGFRGWEAATAAESLFDISMDEAVQFVRGSIRGNRTRRVANSKLLLVRDGTDERDNGPDVELPPQDGETGGEGR